MIKHLFYQVFLIILATFLVGCAKEEQTVTSSENSSTAISNTTTSSITINSYPYTTDNCVYVNGYSTIVQYAQNGEKLKRLKLKKYAEILFIDDNWLYYAIPIKNRDEGVNLYRVPVYVKNDEDIIDYENKEKILTELDGIHPDSLYVKGKYIVYITPYHEFKKFDLESVDFVDVETIKANCIWANQNHFTDSISTEAVYLKYDEKGIYVQNFEDNTLKFLEKIPVESLITTPEGVFYTAIQEEKSVIKVYNEKEMISDVFVSAKQMEELLSSFDFETAEGVPMDTFSLDKLFVHDGRLFMEVSLSGQSDLCYVTRNVVASCSIDNASDLRLEKQITDCLEKNHSVTKEKVNGDRYFYEYSGEIEKMVDGYILFTFYDEKADHNKSGYYNLDSGLDGIIEGKNTKEWLLQWYN